jgi:8-oxo-dGTP pyrophosphatase MutT (NUDIX family)
MATPDDIPPARPAAAVLLVREARGHAEVFLGQRHAKAAFGSAFVFPGGALHAADTQARDYFCGLLPEAADERLGVESGALDFYSAGIREVLEEAGVCFARHGAGGWSRPAEYRRLRERLIEDESRWPALLAESGLRLAADALHYISHWEAPLNVRPRFSARFFVAEAPPGQEPAHDGRELIDSRWLTPSAALALRHAGTIKLAFPTLRNLEMLTEFSSFDALKAWARDRWREGIPKIRPSLVTDGEASRFLLPGDPGYPEAEG